MVKASTVLIVGALGVLAVVAYLVYRTVKNVTDTTQGIAGTVAGFSPKGIADAIGSGYDAINRDLGAGGHAITTGLQNVGGSIGGLFNNAQAPVGETAAPLVFVHGALNPAPHRTYQTYGGRA